MLPDIMPGVPGANGSEFRAQHEVQLGEVLTHLNLVVAQTVVPVFELQRDPRSLLLDREELKDMIDTVSANSQEQGLHMLPIVFEMVTFEGMKDMLAAAEEGRKKDLPILFGKYGHGYKIPLAERHVTFKDIPPHVELAADPVEGTDKAAKLEDEEGTRLEEPGENGAVSIIGGILKGHIAPVPSGKDSDARYADRIVASSRLRGLVSVANTPEQNVNAVMKIYELSDVHDVSVVVLGEFPDKERIRNRELIARLKKMGANVIEIKVGDLMPALKALTEDKPYISMGSGGNSEAVIAALAAKALGGAFDLRYVTKTGEPSKHHPGVRGLDQIISGRTDNAFVTFASITGVRELAIERPRYIPTNGVAGHLEVPIGMITSHSSGLIRARVNVAI